MPTTRSESSRSKTTATTGETVTSRDWSQSTPAETTITSVSQPSRSTLTRRTPPPSIGGDASHVREVTVPTSGIESAERMEPPAPLSYSKSKLIAPLAITETAQRSEQTQRNLEITHTKKTTNELDSRSVRSMHRKESQAHVKMELARRELEVAQAKLKLAQAELIGTESEDEEIEQNLFEKTQEVEEWLIRTEGTGTRPHQPEKEKRSDIQELAQAIAKLSERSTEPVAARFVELPYFNGSCEEWLSFKRTYEDTAAPLTNAQNLARLRRAIQGRAREAVQSLLFTTENPKEVLKGLEARFGRPGALAFIELDKMKNLSRVSENPSDICVFASKVHNAVATIKALKKPQYLSSPETMKAIIEKMPSSMKFRWFTYHKSRRQEEVPELSLIDSFLEIEADICGDFAPPETTWEARRPHKQQSEIPSEQRKMIRRPVHVVQEEQQEKRNTCPICQGDHFTDQCEKFKAANIDERWNLVKRSRICFKCLHYRHSRLNCKAAVCKKCGRWHHTSLHSERPPIPSKEEVKRPCYNVERCEKDTQVEEKIASIHTTVSEGKAYLKMIPVDLYGPKGRVRILALLDEGSTVTLLDVSVAKQIGAEGKREILTIETVGGKAIKNESQRIKLKIKGAHRRDKRTIEARTIEGLRLTEQAIDEGTLNNCEHLRKIRKQIEYQCEKPKLLIGQDNWGLIVTRKLKKGRPADPVASLTSLGWVLHGSDGKGTAVVNFINYCRSEEENIDEIVRQHFKLESLGIACKLPSNDSDRRALEVLEKTTLKSTSSNHYETGLIWKKSDETLPNNYVQAYRRLINIEKKLDRDEELKESYGKQIDNLIEKGYAEKAPATSTSGRTFYLPHFAVVHPVKRKPRIVFDAAARFEGKSLNDALLAGPDLLQSLFGVLLRFREGPIAVMADIQDMFLRIKIREVDRDSLRFLWRGEDRKKKPEELRMTSVIFGAASSPATAIYVMNKNAEQYKDSHPRAVKAIRRNHYMDDYLQSFSSIEDARETASDVKRIHEQANLLLKGWACNVESVLEGFEGRGEKESLEITKEEKTLGLRWLKKEDKLAFNIGLRNTSEELRGGEKIPTKREVTSAVMSTFDPMGFATPVLIRGKMLIQNIWRSKVGWDEEIPEGQIDLWLKYLDELSLLTELEIPRCISAHSRKGQLHTFTDASEEAYAAAVYWRTRDPDGTVRVALIAGKARVTPTRPVSIPRLELQAALLGSRLAATIEKETDLEITDRMFWTDSSTVLQWVKADPRKFKTFVAHRLAEIEELTKPCEWRYVPTKENPADDATRSIPNDFNVTARWFQGPTFLRREEEDWPMKRFEKDGSVEQLEEKTSPHIIATVKTFKEEMLDVRRFSSWLRLLRTMARVIMFIDKLKVKKKIESINMARKKDDTWKPQKKQSAKKSKTYEPTKRKESKYQFALIEESHLRRAEEFLIQKIQKESFEKELKRLEEGKPTENSSRLRKIDVYLGSDGLIKLRSRTKKFSDQCRKMNPAVMDGKHAITRLIIEHYHKKFLHGNTATVMNEIRQKYWILGLRTTIKGIIYSCHWCKLRKGKLQIPPTGDLPIERLQHHQFPFTGSAVDYFGPMLVTVGRRVEKRWGALFTCLTTRAIHLELVPSLSTSSMIMALRRMVARRGTPRVIYSDNGTNFVGANRELQEAAADKGIRWKFIPPGSPNMGGAWESLVRSVKTALSVVLNERNPPEEVLYTLMTEVEHIVNSRPLTHLSMDPDDEECLTPNHFLLGRSCGTTPTGDLDDRELIGKASWKTTQVLTDHFWKRWVKEYLPTLMPRKITGRETTDPRLGDIVLIVDATLPRNTWPRGRVIKTYPGPDGRTRILDVQTAGGVLRRPSRRVIILLPAESSPQLDGVQRTAGEIVSDA